MAATLAAGESLGVNQSLQSENGQFLLIMQPDGNLVMYRGALSSESAVWSTETAGLEPLRRPTRAVMQDDGNFRLYSDVKNPTWDSGTDGNRGARLVLQDDGNLVISGAGGFDGYGVGQNGAVWTTNTAALDQQPQALAATGIPITADTGRQNVAWGKWMQTWATLYRDGRLQLSTFTQNDNWWAGLRGRVLVVCVDAGGRAIWVSQEFRCATRCSVPDFSCASYGTSWFTENFPAEVGQYTIRLDVYQTDTDTFLDLRRAFCDAIKALGPVLVASRQPELAALGGAIAGVLQCE